MKFQAAAVLAATMAFAQPAAAQMAPSTAPAPLPYPEMRERQPDDPLQGLRFEVAGGYDRLEINYVEDDTKYYDGADGVRYGGEIGYDLAIGGKVLVGAYAAYAGSSIKRCDDFGVAIGTICQRPKSEVSGGARVGLRIGRQSQLYGKVGYASMPLEFSLDTIRESETYAGFHFGFGGELGIGGGAFVKAELVATDFRTNGKTYEDLNFDRRHAVAGLGVRF
ncbi:outer membrane beta-barrel protein [Sphingomonas sp. SAFR-052]|uniref:outer membrane beta-barrel protein n=1 Tax=Sphingomonas sp. SAFR-052 TaxID=3436867 RepID=UPI003F812E01